MQTTTYKIFESLILFVGIPLTIVSSINVVIKISLLLLGFLYVVCVLLIVEKNKFKISENLNWQRFWQLTTLKFLVIVGLTTIYVYIYDVDHLFGIVRHKPLSWAAFSVAYCAYSVYPQELIFRTFFFQRYRQFIQSEEIFILINAAVFSFAHIIFKNGLVILITFLGGLLFGFTFTKTKSTILVSIEHAIYGCWLFTVGMGSMLGFPT